MKATVYTDQDIVEERGMQMGEPQSVTDLLATGLDRVASWHDSGLGEQVLPHVRAYMWPMEHS